MCIMNSWFRHYYLSMLALRPSPAGPCYYDGQQVDPDQFRASKKVAKPSYKIARTNYPAKSESSKGCKYLAPVANYNPAGNKSVPSTARTSPRSRDSSAVPSLGTLCGGRRLPPKVYINTPGGVNEFNYSTHPVLSTLPFKECHPIKYCNSQLWHK